jgi:hypothetical protein
MKSSPTNPVPADVKTLRQELEQIFVRTKRASSKKNKPTDRAAPTACLVIKGK